VQRHTTGPEPPENSALLKALPGVGAVKAAKLLEELSIADTRRIGGLGANQRQALIEASSAS
jgi:hypothetical protein